MILAITKLFCQKRFVLVTRAGIFIWDNFNPARLPRSRSQQRASHMNTSKILRRKEWRGEILETETARLIWLIRRGPKAPFIGSRVPETTLPRGSLAEVSSSLFLWKINEPFTLESRTCLGGRVVSPRQVG